jgi:magnesium-transporting ATPase (P-type)
MVTGNSTMGNFVSLILLVFAMTRKGVGSLTPYHELVVLNLCWLNILATVPPALSAIVWEEGSKVKNRPQEKAARDTTSGIFIGTLFFFTAMAAFGRWVFTSELDPEKSICYTYSVFGHNIQIANKSFRIFCFRWFQSSTSGFSASSACRLRS